MPSGGALVHFLETSLLHLHVIDNELWKRLPAAAFGAHAPIVHAISAFLDDREASGIEPNRGLAEFCHMQNCLRAKPGFLMLWLVSGRIGWRKIHLTGNCSPDEVAATS